MIELLMVSLLLSVSWFSIWLCVAFSPLAAACTLISFCGLMCLLAWDMDRG